MTTSDLRGPGAAAAVSRAIVWSILGIAVVVFLGTLVLSAMGIASTVSSGTIGMTLSTEQPLPAEADQGPATLLEGGFDTATVVVGGLDGGTFAVALIAKILLALTQLAVAASVAVLCWSLLRASPFRRSLSTTVTISGGVVLIGGMSAAVLTALASWMTAGQLNASTDDLDGFWPITATVDPSFLVVGITFLLIGLAFDYGDKLQRDTAGLV